MVKVTMPGTLLNKKLLGRYQEMVDDLYVEAKESAVMGSSVFDNIVMRGEPGQSEPRQSKSKKKKMNVPRKK